MTLPEDVAALLRSALVEANSQPNAYECYRLLAETIDNLLSPLPIEPDRSRLALVEFKAATLAELKEAYGQGDWVNIYHMIQELSAE